ncbi:hypothetical protein MN608_09389 [Microdochium nivale]|nr:hypothetical protein MN608_09389 [Microdochium nivale]
MPNLPNYHHHDITTHHQIPNQPSPVTPPSATGDSNDIGSGKPHIPTATEAAFLAANP